jgi:hypothetical protein
MCSSGKTMSVSGLPTCPTNAPSTSLRQVAGKKCGSLWSIRSRRASLVEDKHLPSDQQRQMAGSKCSSELLRSKRRSEMNEEQMVELMNAVQTDLDPKQAC